MQYFSQIKRNILCEIAENSVTVKREKKKH